MCPFCFATLGLVVVGTVSTGGLAAIGVKLSHRKNDGGASVSNSNNGADGMEHDSKY
jgi:hypothetical protein